MTSTSEQPPYTFGPVATDLLGKRVQWLSTRLQEGTVHAIVPYVAPDGSVSLRVWVIGSLSRFVNANDIVAVL